MYFSEKTRRKFREKVHVKKNGCWKWRGAKDHRGYGRQYLSESQKQIPAHQLIFIVENGPIPDGHEVHHKCRCRDCVRPSHLRLVTHRENSRLAAEAGSWSGEKNGRTNKKEADIVAIILLHEHLNIPVKKIAEATGIPLRTVYSYIKREAWSRVKIPSTPLGRDEFLQNYLIVDLPAGDSPHSRQIRSLINHPAASGRGM